MKTAFGNTSTFLIGFIFVLFSFKEISLSTALIDKRFNYGVSVSKRDAIMAKGQARFGDRSFIDDVIAALYTASKCYYKAHNNGSTNVKNDTMQKYAQDWADEMAETDTLGHSSDRTCGENVWAGSPSLCDGAISDFHSEEEYYDYSDECTAQSLQTTGHFTQCVWKASTQIGIGLACNEESGFCYICVRYYKPGNYVGKCSTNVFVPDSTDSTC